MATFVLLFGITSAIIVLQAGFRALDTARSTTIASQIIQSEMERIRLLPWAPTASTDPEKAISTLPATASIDLSSIFPPGASTTHFTSRFNVTRTSTDVPGRSGEMKQISITVTWTGIDGLAHSRSTFTQYAKDGLYDYYYSTTNS